MFKSKDLVQSPLTVLMARDPATSVAEVGGGRGGTYLNDRAWLQSPPIGGYPHLRASLLVGALVADLNQIEDVCCQRQQVLLLNQKPTYQNIGFDELYRAFVLRFEELR